MRPAPGKTLPSRVVTGERGLEVEWCASDGGAFGEPFFEQTLRRLARSVNREWPPARAPIDSLRDVSTSVTPAAFIFHVSRCGSTLVCQMLGALDDTVVISEAPVLDDVLRSNQRQAWVTDADREVWFRGAVHALCGAASGARRAFVKLDGWHLFELPIVRRAFPTVPFIFVYRDPLEVLVSLARVPSKALVRGTVTPAEIGMSSHERDALSRDELAAAVLGSYYRAAARERAELVPFDYAELPALVWRALPGCRFMDHEVERMRQAATRHAKDPARPFTSDITSKRRAASPETRAACARWADAAYEAWLATIERPARGPRDGVPIVGRARAGDLTPTIPC